MEKNEEKGSGKYVEILGDTVKGSQLIIAIILSVIASFLSYELGQWFFTKYADPTMINSYSLLVGIVAILIVVTINIILFKPKRILMQDASTSSSMREAFEDLQLDIDEEIRLIKEDAITTKELKDLGILDDFLMMKGEDKE